MARLNTKLESEGAEFLVLGQLLLHRIASYKTYTNMPGYDIVATNPESNRAAKIQVKSRWRTSAPFFLIKNFDCDFVVAVKLNRGKKGGGGEIKEPEYYVLPIKVVMKVLETGDWSKVRFNKIGNLEQYKDNWGLIEKFLRGRKRS